MSAFAPVPVAAECRYRLAAELLAGTRVADVCCGTGRGAALLAEVCDVVGVDGDVAQVEAGCSALAPGGRLRLHAADVVAWLDGPDPDVDAFVCLAGPLSSSDASVLAALSQRARAGSPVIATVDARLAATITEWTSLGAVCLDQYTAESSCIVAAGADPVGQRPPLETGEDGGAPVAAILVANVRGDALAAARGHGRVVAGAASSWRLELANAELRRANQRLGRQWLGAAGSAAAARLAREHPDDVPVPAEVPERLHEEYVALEVWAHGLDERVRSLEAELAAIRSARAWKLVSAWWRLRARLRRG